MSTNGRDSERRALGVHFEGDLRRILVETAVAMVGEVGVDAVTLRAIARRAGVSHAAPAHHFGDKAGLLTAAATDGFLRLAAALGAVTGPAEPIGRIAALGRAYVAFAEAERGYFEIMFRPALLRPADPDLQSAGDATIGVLRKQVEHCQRDGWRTGVDLAQLTLTLWSLAHGVATLRNQRAFDRHLDVPLELVEQMATDLLGPG